MSSFNLGRMNAWNIPRGGGLKVVEATTRYQGSQTMIIKNENATSEREREKRRKKKIGIEKEGVETTIDMSTVARSAYDQTPIIHITITTLLVIQNVTTPTTNVLLMSLLPPYKLLLSQYLAIAPTP